MTLFTEAVDTVVALLACAAFGLQLVRWLRVLQREHYEPRAVLRFYGRWAVPAAGSAKYAPSHPRRRPVPWILATFPLAVVFAGLHFDVAVLAVLAVFGIVFPRGLSLRGRTGALVWTRRLRTVAGVTMFLSALVALVGLLTRDRWIVAALIIGLVPLLVALAAAGIQPLEERLARHFVRDAAERLARIHPRVVAITGSYGKTSTKHHLAELLGSHGGVVPSPRSYDNRAGLSRAINENVTDATRIFIAEMGTYGPGEIRALCSWCPPEIAIITAIAPVHLERMKSLRVVEAAKFEITERAGTIVLNVDDPLLATWVSPLRDAGKCVWTAGSITESAHVRVTNAGERWQVNVGDEVVAVASPVVGVRESNLACAIASALALDVGIEEIVGRFTHLTAVPNRMVVATAPSGVMVIDDTFNANPVGAASALATLTSLPLHGRRVVVTPGMVEMGAEQFAANANLAQLASDSRVELIVVGRTNVVALAKGYHGEPRRFDHRDEAVAWIRANLHTGDGVLYLNDLPDHYP